VKQCAHDTTCRSQLQKFLKRHSLFKNYQPMTLLKGNSERNFFNEAARFNADPAKQQ
jgi:hypothetical protein